MEIVVTSTLVNRPPVICRFKYQVANHVWLNGTILQLQGKSGPFLKIEFDGSKGLDKGTNQQKTFPACGIIGTADDVASTKKDILVTCADQGNVPVDPSLIEAVLNYQPSLRANPETQNQFTSTEKHNKNSAFSRTTWKDRLK